MKKNHNLKLLLPFASLVIVAGCNFEFPTSSSSSQPREVVDVTIQTYDANQKIRQDVALEPNNSSLLEFHMVRNEYEGGQIVLNPAKKVSYTVKTNDLKTDNGIVLSKDNIEIYHQLYMNIVNPFAASQHEQDLGLAIKGLYEGGYFPDALLQYDVAVANKKNVIEAKKNQGIYVSIKTPKDQTPGVYKGYIDISVGNKTRYVPVHVTVYNFTLSDAKHLKTAFGFNYSNIKEFEGITDTAKAKELYTKYSEEFYDKYRLEVGKTGNLSDTTSYLEKLAEMVKDEGVTSTTIKWSGTQAETVNVNSDNYICVGNEPAAKTQEISSLRFAEIESIILEIFKKSITERTDLFSKMGGTFSVFDEADGSYLDTHWKYNSAVYSMRRLRDLCDKLADLLESDGVKYENGMAKFPKCLNFNTANNDAGVGYELINSTKYTYSVTTSKTIFNDIKMKFAQSLRNYKPIQTLANLDDKFYNNVDVKWCPAIYHYRQEGIFDRAKAYAEKTNGEIWSYTAVNPSKPYPSYHMNDDLISSRIYNWMMYKMGIKGNLYWATIWTGFEGSKYTPQQQYSTPRRDEGKNGDGFLIYPGSVWGMEDFVPSIRLMSIRDANEDYDMLYELEHSYTGTDFQTKLSDMCNGLFDNCYICYDENYKANDVLATFAQSRKTLCTLLDGKVYTK